MYAQQRFGIEAVRTPLFRPLSRRRLHGYSAAVMAVRNHLHRFQAQLVPAARVRRSLIRALLVQQLMPDVGTPITAVSRAADACAGRDWTVDDGCCWASPQRAVRHATALECAAHAQTLGLPGRPSASAAQDSCRPRLTMAPRRRPVTARMDAGCAGSYWSARLRVRAGAAYPGRSARLGVSHRH